MPMDISYNVIDPKQHIVIPVSQDPVAPHGELDRTQGVLALPLQLPPTVHFHDQPGLRAQKVDDVTSQRHLATKAETFEIPTA